jgi:translation initiation factor 5B
MDNKIDKQFTPAVTKVLEHNNTFIKKPKHVKLLSKQLSEVPINDTIESDLNVNSVLDINERKIIVTVLGNVSVGKTTFIEKLERKTNNSLTNSESNGITQQISAMNIDKDILINNIPENLKNKFNLSFVIMDTPGHTVFHNIRNTVSKISHITLVLIDIIKGLDQDTLDFLKNNVSTNRDYDKTILVLTKMDKIYGYKTELTFGKTGTAFNGTIKNILKNQKKEVIKHLENYYDNIVRQVSEIEMYAQPYYLKKDRQCLAMCPVSSISGDGIPDLLLYISNVKLKLDECNESYGYIIDKRISSNYGKVLIGIMKNGSLLKNHNLKIDQSYFPIKLLYKVTGDIRNEHYNRCDKVDEATCFMVQVEQYTYNSIEIGTKFVSTDKSVIDSNLDIKLELESNIDINNVINNIKTKYLDVKGVHLVIPSESMIEGTYNYFSNKISTNSDLILPFTVPILNYSIGSISKKDIYALDNTNKFDSTTYDLRYNCILYCIPDMDMKSSEEQLMIQYFDLPKINIICENKIKCIFGGTIYSLISQYEIYLNECRNNFINKYKHVSAFKIETLDKCIFRCSNPIIIGVKVLEGAINIGSIIVHDDIEYGTIESIQLNNKDVNYAIQGSEVCCKVGYKTDEQRSSVQFPTKVGNKTNDQRTSIKSKTLDKNTKYVFYNKQLQNKTISNLVADDIKLYNEYLIKNNKSINQ